MLEMEKIAGAGVGTRRNGHRRRRKREVPDWEPEWTGKLFELSAMRYGSHRDPETGSRRFAINLSIRGPGGAEYVGRTVGDHGTITAFDHALRTALERWCTQFQLPEIKLLSYRIALADPSRGMDSSAVAEARVRFDGHVYKRKVKHSDGVIAMCLLLLSVYDRFCYKRWRELLRKSGVSPEEAIANRRQAQVPIGHA